MNRYLKILVYCAVVVLAASLLLLAQQTWQGGRSAQDQQTTGEIVPRQELVEKYFRALSLGTTDVAPGGTLTLTWQKQPTAPTETRFFIRLVDQRQGIFISETKPQLLSEADGAELAAPKTPGLYEAWLYLTETDNIQALAQTFPFTVTDNR